MAVLVGISAVDEVIAAHDGLGLCFLDHDLEPGQVQLPQGAFIHHGIRRHAAQLLAVDGKVLGAGGDAVGLDAPHIARCHFARKIRILGEILKVAAAEGAALGIQAWPQQHGNFLCGGFFAHCLADLFAQGRVPAARHSGRRGEAGGRNTGVQPQVVRRARLLAHAVRTIRKGDGRDIIFRQCTGSKGSSARKQRTFLFKRQSLQLFLLHKVVPFLKNSLAAHRTTAQSRRRWTAGQLHSLQITLYCAFFFL